MSIHSEFQQLPISMKIQLVQELWDQIGASPESIPVPEWHRAELERRQRDRVLSPDPGEDWHVVRQRLLESP